MAQIRHQLDSGRQARQLAGNTGASWERWEAGNARPPRTALHQQEQQEVQQQRQQQVALNSPAAAHTCTGCRPSLVLPMPSTVITCMPSTCSKGEAKRQAWCVSCRALLLLQHAAPHTRKAGAASNITGMLSYIITAQRTYRVQRAEAGVD